MPFVGNLEFLLNYIPNIGSIIELFRLLCKPYYRNGFGIGFGVTIGVIAINMVVGNIIEPKMMGSNDWAFQP